jgi:hypothetical protein
LGAKIAFIRGKWFKVRPLSIFWIFEVNIDVRIVGYARWIFFLGENEEVISPQLLCNISSNEHLKINCKTLKNWRI